MQTRFAPDQLADAQTRESEKILRTCVHCGFCTATCPTYLLLGDELDSPRGRIYLIKDMLEGGRAATPQVVKHIDRCLSCLSCMTTCPSGVNYMHLVDHARAYIEDHLTDPGLSASHVAAATGISDRHLSRAFAAAGTSLPQFVLARRLERARGLLVSGERRTIADVAARCGFGSAAYFSQAFRAHFGVRPADARRP